MSLLPSYSKVLMVFILLLLLDVCIEVKCSLISQSSIASCLAGNDLNPKQKDGSPCKELILVSVTLNGDQQGTESIYADIDQVYNQGDSELSRLRKPFRIELFKSQVSASYNVHYIGSANARPSEYSFQRKKCRDDWHGDSSSLACGKQIGADGEPVWDSQGFCCRCQDFFRDRNRRGDFKCKSLIAEAAKWASAHCLTNNDLWYNVFEISPPMLQYQITLRMLEFSGIVRNSTDKSISANWREVSNIYLDPTQTIARSRDGRVVAEIQGDLVGAQGPNDFSYKYLLIPSVVHWKGNGSLPVQYTNGKSDWMVVDRHLVDLRGETCNRVGASYTAFRAQPGKCNRKQGSCFTNQPLDFWEHDDELRQMNKTGRYLISNYGQIDESTAENDQSFILKLLHEEFHNTFVTLRLDASNVVFVYKVGSARIVDIRSVDFEALTGNGRVDIDIENTGEITAEFTVSVLKCTVGIHAISARTITIDPGVSKTVSFQVRSFRSVSAQHECEVELFDSSYNLLQTGTVNFRTNSTCFCFGTCGCTCDNENMTAPCPEPPPVIIRSPLFIRIVFLLLETIGLHGIVGVVCGTFIVCGFIKLSFGRVLFCRMSKAEELAAELKKEGVIDKSMPLSKLCSTKCHGAKAAKERYRRKLLRLKELGKKPNELDDWRNYSYDCTCQQDEADVRFFQILKAIFCVYYVFMMPCIWVGKKVVWGIFRDTAEQKQKAIDSVLKSAKKKGKLAKYDVIESQAEELRKGIAEEGDNENTQGEKDDGGEMGEGKENEKKIGGENNLTHDKIDMLKKEALATQETKRKKKKQDELEQRMRAKAQAAKKAKQKELKDKNKKHKAKKKRKKKQRKNQSTSESSSSSSEESY